jgi:hypothetical protein
VPSPIRSRHRSRVPSASDAGSQTTEYALLMIVAATVATVAVAWARNGGVRTMLDAVTGEVLKSFGITG